MKGKNTYKYTYINKIIIAVSFIIRIYYILITTVGDRQHDLGYATSLHDDIVNPGHLGYVEYIAKFHHLPDFDPFSIFSYYHPPLHHVIGAVFVNIAHTLGIEEPATYEAIQLPTLIYSFIFILISYKILKMFDESERYIPLPLALIAFHPGLIYMTGSINNDMMALMFTVLCIYSTLLWIDYGYKFCHLICMALSIGFGLIAKPNVGVMAIPMGIIMLLHMMDEHREHRLKNVIGQYIIFAVISIPIGLSWTVRNIIRFRTKPGIPSPSMNQYIGDFSLWSNLGLTANLNLSFPFYSPNATYNNNAWVIMFKSALFTEIWPSKLSGIGLFLCQAVYICSIILAFICAYYCILRPIRLIKNGQVKTGVFLLSGFITIIVTFILFVLKYPYVCSCNFRYIGISLLYSGLALIPYDRK